VLNPKCQAAYAGNLQAIIASVELVDVYTVRVVTKEPNPFPSVYLSSLPVCEGMLMPKKYLEAV
jgi:ABC-type transport system substrate-binding protein